MTQLNILVNGGIIPVPHSVSESTAVETLPGPASEGTKSKLDFAARKGPTVGIFTLSTGTNPGNESQSDRVRVNGGS